MIMGNKVETLQKPVIMTKSFLEEKIVRELALVEGLNISELQRLVKMDGIERNLVLSLQLEQESLLNIGNLWKFTLLTKLEIANNYIEEIEGLETLSSLQYLDLSFNYIKVIQGLDGLINLGYLNLSYNEIIQLENLDNQKNLEIFLVRNNKIKSFENIYYLAQFENLLCLGIEENPFMLTDNAQFRVLAVLPQLKFLDFILVTENQLKEALLLYPVEKKSASKDKLFRNYAGQNFSSLWEINPPDKEAFVDGLAKGRGFEVLLESDKNFRLLYTFPPAATIAENHRKELDELFDEWHDKGRNYYKQMQEEKADFIKMVKEVENLTAIVSGEEEYSYITVTEKIPKKLCLIYQKPISSEQRDQEVERLKEEYDKELRKTHKSLMSSSCLCLDLVFDLMTTFKNEMHLIAQKYLEDVHHIYKELIEKDEMHILKLKQFYSKLFDTGSNYDLEVKNEDGKLIELDPIFLKLMSKKDFVEMVLTMALTIHSTLLEEKIKKLGTSLKNYREDILNSVIENDVLIRQNEKIRNAILFCNKQKYIMDKLFSNSIKFKNYLGYS